MPRLPIVARCFVLLLLTAPINAVEKKEARLIRIGDLPSQEIRVRLGLATADTCIVRHDSGAVWKIDGWVIGNELYKEYLDPAASCANPYPFTVTEIVMAMYFFGMPLLYVSVDVEEVDNSVPGCPFPGDLLAISSEWEVQIPGTGLYEIWVPLDTPQVVNGPFFAGFYIGNALDPADSPAVITDDIPIQCTSYNIWDSTTGYVDLNNNSIWNFPGRLVLYAAGIPGGSGSQPEPALSLIAPENNDTLFGSTDLWVRDTSSSEIIDYVSFEYSSGGSYVEIGRDYDGLKPLRDGVDNSGTGDGFSLNWNFSSLPEGTYTLRATVYDTSGRSSSNNIAVYLEPTPPIPTITSPNDGSGFCSPLELLMTSSDEDLSFIEIYRHDAQINYSTVLVTLNQSTLGDNNGNPGDGNHAANGEYGDYYCGPVAAAIAVKLWFDRGYEQLMKEGLNFMSIDTVAERLAEKFATRENLGTYDENLLAGLKEYSATHGNELTFDYRRNPDYFLLRGWIEEEEKAVIIGLGGTPGVWLAVDGFSEWEQPDGSYLVRLSDPLTGTLVDVAMRTNLGTNQVHYNGNWQRVDLMVSLLAKDWAVSRSLIGADMNGADGWSFSWTPTGLTEENPYFFPAFGHDAGGLVGSWVVLLKYNCSQTYTPGDYDGDDQANVVDLNYLMQFITLDGPAPIGGAGRADANCDNHVNVADVVYYMNYLFNTAGPPCY